MNDLLQAEARTSNAELLAKDERIVEAATATATAAQSPAAATTLLPPVLSLPLAPRRRCGDLVGASEGAAYFCSYRTAEDCWAHLCP